MPRSAFPLKVPLDGYVLEERIGAGRMGAVYRATHLPTSRTVAVKFMALTDPSADTEEARQRFLREADVLSRLSHPNVVGYCGSGEVRIRGRDYLYLAMDFLPELETMGVVHDRLGSLPWLLDRAEELLAGLEYLREHSVVHRDLKPDNLGIPRDGKLRILDLGLARILEQSDLTRPGRTFGSLYYISPEQLTDARRVDTRSDLYSVGMVLYELAGGGHPLLGLSWSESAERTLSGNLPDTPRPLPEGLKPFVKRLLALDPGARFQTPGEALAALRELRGAGGLPPSCGEMPAEWGAAPEERTVRSSAWIPVAVATLLVVLCLVVGYLFSRWFL
ncbi:MAG: serine/threonine protein kinase [Armatimonadetes bacterium]|nr:serine/threonine protein kinase [Armatimonadota bacterium]